MHSTRHDSTPSESTFATQVKLARGRRALAAGLLVAVGLCDVTANGLLALALTKGLVSLVSVLASLYPVVTALLARQVLGERLRRIQAIGATAAMVGVLLAAGG